MGDERLFVSSDELRPLEFYAEERRRLFLQRVAGILTWSPNWAIKEIYYYLQLAQLNETLPYRPFTYHIGKKKMLTIYP